MRSLFAASGQEGEQGEDRLAVLEGDFTGFATVAAMPTERRPPELLRCPIAHKKDQLQGLGQTNVRNIGGRGKRFGEAAAVERSTKS